MAKIATAENLSPLAVSVGAIAAARAGARAEALLNYVAGRRPHVHLSLGAATLAGALRPPVDLYIPSSGSLLVLQTRIRIPVDATELTIGARCQFATAGDAATVAVDINGNTVTIAADDTDNGTELLDTLATSLTGVGWQDVTVTLARVTGTGHAFLRNLSIQDSPITDPTLLPDPAND